MAHSKSPTDGVGQSAGAEVAKVEEPAHGSTIVENRRCVNLAVGDFGGAAGIASEGKPGKVRPA